MCVLIGININDETICTPLSVCICYDTKFIFYSNNQSVNVQFKVKTILICYPKMKAVRAFGEKGSTHVFIGYCKKELMIDLNTPRSPKTSWCHLVIWHVFLQALFSRLWFSLVDHVDVSRLYILSDVLLILSFVLLSQGCRGCLCTGDKIQIWRNRGKSLWDATVEQGYCITTGILLRNYHSGKAFIDV